MKPLTVLFLFPLTLTLSSCEKITEAFSALSCQFRVKSVSETRISGISIQNKTTVSEISAFDLLLIGSDLTAGKIPFAFNLNLEAKNPNDKNALLAAFDWILVVNDQELITGTLANPVTLPGGDAVTGITLPVETDLLALVPGGGLEDILNVALAVSGYNSKPGNVKVKIKPNLSVAGVSIPYGDYITVGVGF